MPGVEAKSLIKYFLGGISIAAITYYIHTTASLREIGMIAITTAVAFAVLDLLPVFGNVITSQSGGNAQTRAELDEYHKNQMAIESSKWNNCYKDDKGNTILLRIEENNAPACLSTGRRSKDCVWNSREYCDKDGNRIKGAFLQGEWYDIPTLYCKDDEYNNSDHWCARAQKKFQKDRNDKWQHCYVDDNRNSTVMNLDEYDPACLSLNGKDCEWNKGHCDKDGKRTTKFVSGKIDPLYCGEMHKKHYGDTGYGNPKHWCTRMKKPQEVDPKWKRRKEENDRSEWQQCVKDSHGNTFLVKKDKEDPACLSVDGRRCLDGYCDGNEKRAKFIPESVIPLYCGEDHKGKYGDTGYENPNHWCARAKQLLPNSGIVEEKANTAVSADTLLTKLETCERALKHVNEP
jgi:hypothetical protein